MLYRCQKKSKKARYDPDNLTIPIRMFLVKQKEYRFGKMVSFPPKVSSCMLMLLTRKLRLLRDFSHLYKLPLLKQKQGYTNRPNLTLSLRKQNHVHNFVT